MLADKAARHEAAWQVYCGRRDAAQLGLQAAGLEMMLRKFEQPRPFVVFNDEMKRETIAENHRLVDEVERLGAENSELKDEVAVMRQRLAVMKKRRRGSGGGGDDERK
jgi:predicted nuclease with TOPRIM domain